MAVQSLENEINTKDSKKSFNISDFVMGSIYGFVETSFFYISSFRKIFNEKDNWNNLPPIKKGYKYGSFTPNVPAGPISLGVWDWFLIYKPLIMLCGDKAGRDLLKLQIATNAASLAYEIGRGAYRKYNKNRKIDNLNPKESI